MTGTRSDLEFLACDFHRKVDQQGFVVGCLSEVSPSLCSNLAGESFIDVHNQKSFLTLNTLNEFDPKYSGVDRRRKLDTQKGAVLATKLKNNANRIAKWTTQAILASADMMKLGYVTRVYPRDHFNHVISAVVGYKPKRIFSLSLCTARLTSRGIPYEFRGGVSEIVQSLEVSDFLGYFFRRKVDLPNISRAQLRQAIANSEAELATMCSAMEKRPVHMRQSDQNSGSLKAELRAIISELEEMKKRKSERRNHDLSLRKLEELCAQLQALEKEKSDRINQVLAHFSTLNSMCLVLGMDFNQTIHEIHPGLSETGSNSISDDVIKRLAIAIERLRVVNIERMQKQHSLNSISDDVIKRLAIAIERLRDVNIERMQKIQNLPSSLLELCNLMDTPLQEQQVFQSVTCMAAFTL
ncbi:hypothetical protein L2E82_07480 [Cichorium intybus]|uniref:Uncharacterized protein n=1 Tax=Cichorium intybus TaxID=13427 RepID=A0ACB9G5G4_CICIN|nr:hypothetical protein L2E82_07480 [Cichorium intybus]